MFFKRTRMMGISPHGMTLAALPKKFIDATNEPYVDEIQEAMEEAETAVIQ